MPGMMDTILNLGLNDDSVEGLAKRTENRRFAMDSYRRFIQMFGDVVQEISKEKFDKIFDGQKEKWKERLSGVKGRLNIGTYFRRKNEENQMELFDDEMEEEDS
jgi:phosphoenolpyruvate synthase/pyruvate phosphate dikinase